MKNKLLFALLASIGVMGGTSAQTAPTFSGIALTPAVGLAFPLTYLTQESQPLTATIKNTYLGSTATISAVASSDPQYVVTAETCTAAPLAKNGGTCTVTVKYVPTAVATASAAKINITRPTAGGNFWVPVTGIADTVPKVPTLPAATTFSGVTQTPAQGLAFAELLPGLVSPEQTITYKNTYLGSDWTITGVTSSDPNQFEITSQTCTAKPVARNGGTCTVNVRFKPAAAGTFAAKVNVTRTTAGGNFYTNLAGIGKGTVTPTAAGYSGALLTPTSLTFPDTAKGSTSAEQTITVKNTYAGTTWTVNSVTANISSYKVTANDCGTLAPGATCTIKVAFAPTLVQALAGTITINRTVGTTTSNMIVKATGNGIAGTTTAPVLTATPSTLAFDSTAVGASQSKTVTVTNSSTVAQTVTASTGSGSDFAITANTCTSTTLSAGATCTVTLSFAPTAAAARTGVLTITPASGTPLAVSLSGTGTSTSSASLRAEPGMLVLPTTVVGQTSASATINFTNTGSTSLAISGVTSSVPSEFVVSSACSASLAPGATCAASIAFKPSTAGGRTATLSIAHNGTGSPAAVQMAGNGILASDVYAEPLSLDFGAMPTATASAAKTVTFYNAGTTALTLKPLSFTGDASEFSQTNTCGTSLAAGATCTATVTFKPTTTGSKLGTLAMALGSGTLVQAISLSGTATTVQGILTAAPASLTFPSTNVGATSAAQTVTLTNTGTGSLTVGQSTSTSSEFSWTTTCGTLAPGASCPVSVKFNPTTSGAKAGSLTFAHNGQGGSTTIALSGAAAVLPGAITLSPTSLAFPDTTVNSASAAKTITLTNTGGSPVSGLTLTSSLNDFALTSNCGTSLAVGASCTASVILTPSVAGARTGSLSVNWTGASAPVTAGLAGNGIGVPTVALSATSLSFLATEVAQQSAEQAVTVTNGGTGSLAVSSVVLSSADFAQSNDCGTSIAPNGTCQVKVKFTPATAGAKTGTLTLNHNAGTGSSAVSLAGTANLPAGKLTASVTSYAFPNTNVGSAVVMNPLLTLTNTGGQTVALGSMASSNPDFAVGSTTCSTSLAAGGTCTVMLRFTPSLVGSRSGTFTVPYGTGTDKLQVALSGNGINNAQIQVTPTSLTFGPQAVGASSAQQSVTVTNTGTSPLTISSVTSNNSVFTVDGSACLSTLAANTSCTVKVSYLPTILGVQTGVLTLASNAANAASTSVALSGTAANPGVLALSVNPVGFSTTTVGVPTTATVTLSNTGGSSLNVSTITSDSPQVTSNALCLGSLPAGQSCTMTLTLTPSAAGLLKGAVTIAHTGTGGSQVLNWTAVSQAPVPVDVILGGNTWDYMAQATHVLFSDGTLWATGGNGVYQRTGYTLGLGKSPTTVVALTKVRSNVKNVAYGMVFSQAQLKTGYAQNYPVTLVWNQDGSISAAGILSGGVFTTSSDYGIDFDYARQSLSLDNGLVTADANEWSPGVNWYRQRGGSVTAINEYNPFFKIEADGSLWAWPTAFGVNLPGAARDYHDTMFNYWGQLGTGSTGWPTVETKVLTGVARVFTSNLTTFALKTDGTLWAAGKNTYGALGTGDTTDVSFFRQVASNVKEVFPMSSRVDSSIGYGLNKGLSTFILKNDNTLWAAGWNGSGRLGTGTTTNQLSFVQVADNVKAVRETRGNYCTTPGVFLLKTDNSLWAAGPNEQGQLGVGTTNPVTTFTQVLRNIKDVFPVSCTNTFALGTDGVLWATGQNPSGMLGTGTTTRVTSFTAVLNNVSRLYSMDINNVANYSAYSIAVKTDGSMWATGLNGGALSVGDTANRSVWTPMVQMP